MSLMSSMHWAFRRILPPVMAPGSALILLALGFLPASFMHAADNEAGIKFFREKIEPVLQRECYECHSARAKELKAQLRLDYRDGILNGGESGPAVVPGDNESLLLQAIRHEGDLAMPSEKTQLAPNVITDFEYWVKIGAPDPRVDVPVPADPAQNHVRARAIFGSFQPAQRAAGSG